MSEAIRRAREELELAQAMTKRLEEEQRILWKSLDPGRRVVDSEELRLLTENSEWIGEIYRAEQALFIAKHGTPGIVGSHGDYHWITSVDHDISAALSLCPEIALGKYLAVTAVDSGALRLTEQERSDGWWTAEERRIYTGSPDGSQEFRDEYLVAYSPRLNSIHGLPNETRGCCSGFDEWYIFDKPTPPGDIEAFVNWMGLRLYDPVYQWSIDRFWDQMAKLAPESYIADGTVFTFVTRHAELFDRFLAALK